MSDHWIIVMPEKPEYVPSEEAQRKAVALFKQLAPTADEVIAQASVGIRFIDCGANFERVLCPACGGEIEIEWWQNRMDDETEANYPLKRIELPCCRAARSLNEFKYDWPQGFARFSVEARNPGILDLTEAHLKAFEAIIGSRVRKVRQHL